MATSKITYSPPLRTEATHLASTNMIITDAPKDNHGEGKSFSPTDLAATSLASCMLTVMGIYANNSQWGELGEVECELTKVMAADPRRISEIQIEFKWTTSLDSQKIEKLKEIALNCPVAKSLHPAIKQRVNFTVVKK